MDNPISKKFHEQWKFMTGWVSGNIEHLADDDLKVSFATGKNHGVWILGHLIESEDELSKFLGKAPLLYPVYEEMFGQGSKLEPVDFYPSIETLRSQWKEVVAKNDKVLSEMTDAEWDEPHALSAERGEKDFFKTKGRCIMIWNLHQEYHNGQLSILAALAGKSRF